MPRGCHNKKPALSTARRQATRLPTRDAKSKIEAKPTTIVDDRPSQRLRPKSEKVPEWAKLKKGDHEKIAGTRIQSDKGGIAVRVVIEDGKVFPPHKVAAVRKHLRKLAQQAEIKKEIDRIHSSETPIDPASLLSATGLTSSRGQKRRLEEKPASAAIVVPQSKKERKEQQRRQFLARQAEEHAAKVKEDCRELVSQEWYRATIMQRCQGRAWVHLQDAEGLPEHVKLKMRELSAAVDGLTGEGPFLAVQFADVQDRALQLQPGNVMRLKVYTDRHGVGGCEGCSTQAAQQEVAQEPKQQENEASTKEDGASP